MALNNNVFMKHEWLCPLTYILVTLPLSWKKGDRLFLKLSWVLPGRHFFSYSKTTCHFAYLGAHSVTLIHSFIQKTNANRMASHQTLLDFNKRQSASKGLVAQHKYLVDSRGWSGPRIRKCGLRSWIHYMLGPWTRHSEETGSKCNSMFYQCKMTWIVKWTLFYLPLRKNKNCLLNYDKILFYPIGVFMLSTEITLWDSSNIYFKNHLSLFWYAPKGNSSKIK